MQRKLLLFLLVLLTSAGAAWADTVTETAFEQYFNGNSSVPRDYGFEVATASFVAQNRITNNGDGTFTTASNAGNQYALALADLSGIENYANASKVTLEFDAKIDAGHRLLIGIGDKFVRGTNANGSQKVNYNTEGLVMRYGTSDGSSVRVNGGTSNANAFDQESHIKFILDREGGKYSYLITNKSNNQVLFSAENVTTNVLTADVIEAYSWNNNQTFKLGNLTYELEYPATAPQIYFTSNNGITNLSTQNEAANLIDLEFNEPTLNGVPAYLRPVYSSSNPKLAVFDEETKYTGNVRFLNTGLVTITATAGGATASYNVLVSAGDAAYEVNRNTYTLTGAGKLQERQVTSIPCMTMTFGTMEADENGYVDVTIVRDEGDNGRGLVATTLADDGWRDAQFNNGIPTQGTFYMFEPSANGKLNVYGYITTSNTETGDAGTAILYDATATEVVREISAAHRATANFTEVNLIRDHVYYLFGTNPNYNSSLTTWTTYELHSFSYDSSFKFDHPYEILSHGATSANLQIASGDTGGNVTYSLETKGGVNNASLYGETITFEGDNGAIIVTATMGDASIYYVITVPSTYEDDTVFDFYYTGSNTLDNVQSYLQIGNYKETDSPNEADYWAANYKVRTYVNRELTYLNGPVLTVNKSIQGDNAKFIGKTAGLVFTAGAKSFGTNAVSNVTYESTQGKPSYEVDAILKQMLYAPTSTLTPSRRVVIYNGATLTIPQVPNNKFIKIWWTKRSDNDVENVEFDCSNGFKIYDLEGTEITTPFSMTKVNDFLELTQNREQLNGVNVFKLEGEEGKFSDVTINVSGGWVDIFRIEVVDNYDATMHIQRWYASINGNRTQKVTNQSIVFTADETSKTVNYYSGPNNSGGTKGHAYYYRIEAEGNIKATITSPVDGKASGSSHTITVKYEKGDNDGAHVGNVKITTLVKDFTDQYVLDKVVSWIPVGELDAQTYPYTWDFTEASLGQTTAYSNNGSVDADKYGKWDISDGRRQTIDNITTAYDEFGKDLSQNKKKQLFALGSQLTVGGNTIEETKGLGLYANATTDVEMNKVPGVISTLDNVGLLFVNDETTLAPTVTIPAVPSGARIYVKSSKEPLTVSGASSPKSDDAAVGVYRYDADGGDVVISFSNNESVVIYKIAVTNILKEVNHLGFASESRNHNIDHSLNTDLTRNNVKAFAVRTDDIDIEDYQGVSVMRLTEDNQFTVVPQGQGVVLWNGQTNDQGEVFQQPLFYPAMHIEPTNADESLSAVNMMVGAPDGGEVGAYTTVDGTKYANYIMAYRHYTYDIKTGGNGDLITENFEAFYPVMNAGTIGQNKAYLRIDASKLPTPIWEGGNGSNYSVKNVIYIGFVPDGEDINDEPTGISDMTFNGEDLDALNNAEWYNLSGQKLSGRPAAAGVYIVNGKKVFVK